MNPDHKTKTISTIFHTEQCEGRTCKPYISNEKLDICDECYKVVLGGNFIHGWGAMGYNTYELKGRAKGRE